jgi:2-dehydro-3-deoxyphosphogluconate aldolase/(4S)-4-hydroxy-2-oxoglutarate aldolase
MQENLIKLLSKEKIFPILRSSDPQKTVDTAKAIVEGGINILEVNIENPSIFGAIEEISKFATVCAGNIITSIQAQAAIAAGAKVISSPIFQMNMVKISKDKEIPFIAGTSTANEAYNAWKARVPLVKIYPVAALGGLMYLEDLLRPMPFLKVLPLGNVKLSEVQSYLGAGAVAVGVGRDLYEGYSCAEITKRTRGALERLNG